MKERFFSFALITAALLIIGWNFKSSNPPAMSAPDDWPQWRGRTVTASPKKPAC
jgi:heme A synthase